MSLRSLEVTRKRVGRRVRKGANAQGASTTKVGRFALRNALKLKLASKIHAAESSKAVADGVQEKVIEIEDSDIEVGWVTDENGTIILSD